jgi:hypothetical protein
MITQSGWPLPIQGIVWWIIRLSIGFSEDGSIHACCGWLLIFSQFLQCLLSRSEYSALQDRLLWLKEAGPEWTLLGQLNVYHRVEEWSYLDIQIAKQVVNRHSSQNHRS